MRLSIIVPAYKVADYIEKCIRSLEFQDISKEDYEIIVTNDGSPDNCREIVEQLQKEFQNIILINQENQGVSIARNNAIAIAKGNYIMPIDPDDYVLSNTFSAFLSRAETQNLDVLYLGFEIYDMKGDSVWQTNYCNQQNKIYNGVEGYFVPRGYNVRDPDHSVAILYRRKLLQQYEIEYPINVPILEDGLFLGKVFSVAQKVGFDPIIVYQRTTRLSSAINSTSFYSEEVIDGFIKAVMDIKLYKSKNIFTLKQLGLINHLIVKYVFLALISLVSLKRFKRYIKVCQKIKSLGFQKLAIDGVVEPYKKYAKNYNISPYYFLLLYTTEMVFKKISSKK